MAVQARASATRQKIIDAAVELFTSKGYAETGLNDLCEAAEITSGAFYYHFKTKEELAAAVTADGWPKAWDVVQKCMNQTPTGLENVIVMTFAVGALLKRDKSVWMSNYLNQSLGLLSEEGRKSFELKAQGFISQIAASIRPEDIRPGVRPDDVGSQVWMNMHGCHLLSDAYGDSGSERLVRSWKILLGSVVPENSLRYFEELVARTAEQYRS